MCHERYVLVLDLNQVEGMCEGLLSCPRLHISSEDGHGPGGEGEVSVRETIGGYVQEGGESEATSALALAQGMCRCSVSEVQIQIPPLDLLGGIRNLDGRRTREPRLYELPEDLPPGEFQVHLFPRRQQTEDVSCLELPFVPS